MKILVLCDEGNNRSVTIAHHLKYWGHDVLTAGWRTNSASTREMLGDWADRIIITDEGQWRYVDIMGYNHKTQLWDIGPDRYPRPFNKQLHARVRELMDEHRSEYKSTP